MLVSEALNWHTIAIGTHESQQLAFEYASVDTIERLRLLIPVNAYICVSDF